MNAYTLEPMPTTIVGEGSVAGFAQHVRAHGSRAFVVSDPGVRAAGIVDTVVDALTKDGLEWTVFDDVETLSATVGTDRSLRDLGAKAQDIDALTSDAWRDIIILNTPRYPSREEVHALYQQAL